MDNDTFYNFFKSNVPITNYEEIHHKWWKRTLDGEKDICWPGNVKFFALSSGTSGASSKYIPVTTEMHKSIQRTSVRQILTLSKYDLPEEFFGKGILTIGGSTELKYNGIYYEGDLSGITTGKLPLWFQRFSKPGKDILKKSDWNEKLSEMVLNAKDWDIGIVAGVPAWVQILIEKILSHYKLSNIHELWPNFKVYVHGGVAFESYKKGFEKLLGKELIFMETYLASEGFLAYQASPHSESMRLVLNNGMFYEFIPHNDKNFDSEGELSVNPETLKIDEIEEGQDYAILLSTNAGAWRYLIGDVIKFVSKQKVEIVIVGRTKHFLSICGEHLSNDNMNKAIQLTAEKLGIDINEFTVIGEEYDNLFAHRWYIGSNDLVDPNEVKGLIDSFLCELNDDYRVERQAAIKEVIVEILPVNRFYDWLKLNGKEGGQHKFPRVLKGDKMNSWNQFLKNNPVNKN